MSFSALCRILVRFGPVTPKFTLLKSTLRLYGKNWHITPNISEYPGPIFTYFTGLVGIMVGMIIRLLTFVWLSSKRRCYSNQLNMEEVRRGCQE